jgi:hypothetical protein
MPVRYYPSFRIVSNLNTKGGELILNGVPYVGRYYKTYDGKFFSGPNPSLGPNEQLDPIPSYATSPALSELKANSKFKNQLLKATKQFLDRIPISPTAYFPKPLPSDYSLGYLNRCFVKKSNENGYITEISPKEYTDINNGNVGYDTTILQTYQIAWKLTGPLNSKRISQYDTRAGIIDTNKRLVESANPVFFGIIDYIGGDYSRFAKPTE